MALDAVLVLAGAAALGGFVTAAPSATVAFALAASILLRRVVAWRVLLLAWVLFAGVAAVAVLRVSAFEARLLADRAVLGAPRRCSGVGTVETSPALRDGALAYVASFPSLDCEERRLGPVRVRLREGPPELARGDRVEVVAQLASVELFRNAELPDPTPVAARAGVTLSGSALSARVVDPAIGLAAWIDRQRARVRAHIEGTFVPAAAPMARALVLGENDLSEDDGAAFRASGLAHLLAVSGTHLVFAVLGVVQAVAFVLVRIEALAARRDVGRLAAGLGAVLAPLYADFAGGSGSAWRAAFMLSVGLGARALGRRPQAVRSFALSVGLGVAFDPLVALDVSFVLSAAATAGLLSVGPPLTARLLPSEAGRVRRSLVGSTIATVSAMLPCAPLLATLGPRLTLAGLVANVAAVPFGEVVSLPLCLVHAIVPGGMLARGIALVASGALLVVRWLARASAGATWLAVPVPPPGAWHFVVLGTGALGVMLTEAGARRGVVGRRGGFVVGTVVGLGVLEAALVRAGHPRGGLRVTVLDVGQGDSALIDLPDGKLMLVDGGGFVGSPVDPGRQVILPLLRVRRRERLDVVVLSHPHPDHFGGLATVARAVDVGELWDTGQGREQGAGPVYAAMIADLSSRGIRIRGPDELCGPPRRLGGADVTVLAPCPAFDPVLGANDNSFVMRLGVGTRRVLMMGDAEHVEEEALLARGPPLDADVLKVGHHGSRTSTSRALLAAVKPRFATVSCGARNRFGHPFPGTISALEQAGVRALRTDVGGSAEIRTDGTVLEARIFGASFEDRFRRLLW